MKRDATTKKIHFNPKVVTPERFYRGSSPNILLDSRFSLRLIRPKPCGGKSMRE